MVSEEGKTKIPVLENFTNRGFDPERHRLQSYGTGWQSAAFLTQERQLLGAPGGIFHDWDLKTNLDGVYAAGDQLYASDCAGFAAATGYYAGRKAAKASEQLVFEKPDPSEIGKEKERLYAPLYVKLYVKKEEGMDWRELNKAISKAMQNYCGGVKNDMLLEQGLQLLEQYKRECVPMLFCRNPHELMRTHEVLDIPEVNKLILNACMLRKSSSEPLCFERSDFPQMDPPEDDCFITIRQEGGRVYSRKVPKDYYGDVKDEYEKHNADYKEEAARYAEG